FEPVEGADVSTQRISGDRICGGGELSCKVVRWGLIERVGELPARFEALLDVSQPGKESIPNLPNLHDNVLRACEGRRHKGEQLVRRAVRCRSRRAEEVSITQGNFIDPQLNR